ncbi:MAG: SOS response-associated peptidase [Dehalococcoidia bacterium]|nr:SOS response-associated peptidase [Dehalococcoidia bacterium]
MCGRFTLTKSERAELEDEMGLARGSLSPGYQARFNIAPTDEHFIVRQRLEEREAVPAKWGLVNHWVQPGTRPAPQINARSEGIDRRPAFRDAFASRRCLVPADGFFEWVGEKSARKPIWFHRPGREAFWFAGLYESWNPTPDTRQRTFTIITTTANSLVAPVHDRMPVILSENAAEEWLNPNGEPARLLALLQPAPDSLLIAREVSTLANSVKNDSPAILEPAEPPPQQLSFEP